MLASAIVLFAGILVMSIVGLRLGLDFTGGNMIEVRVGATVNENHAQYSAVIREVFEEENVPIARLQRQGRGPEGGIVVQFQDVSGLDRVEMEALATKIGNEIVSRLNERFGHLEARVESSERITRAASRELVNSAIIAITVAIALMLLYIAFRFELFSGLCAVVGLAHDVLITLAFVAFFQITINSAFIAVIVTIIAYSINNTIVVFDRMREMYFKGDKKQKQWNNIVNSSIKQTLARTMIMSATTLFAIIMLTILGVVELREFVLPIMFGFIAGTYSTIFVVGPLFAHIANWRNVEFKKRFAKPEAAAGTPNSAPGSVASGVSIKNLNPVIELAEETPEEKPRKKK